MPVSFYSLLFRTGALVAGYFLNVNTYFYMKLKDDPLVLYVPKLTVMAIDGVDYGECLRNDVIEWCNEYLGDRYYPEPWYPYVKFKDYEALVYFKLRWL